MSGQVDGFDFTRCDRVALDLDGVLCDFVTPFVAFCRDKYDPGLPTPTRQAFMRENWHWTRNMATGAMIAFVQAEGLLKLPTLPGVERLSELVDLGLRLDIHTARSSADVDETVDWITDNIGIGHGRVVFGPCAKVLDSTYIAGVDDDPRYVAKMMQTGAPAFQMSTPYNQHPDDRYGVRVDSLGKFIDIVTLAVTG